MYIFSIVTCSRKTYNALQLDIYGLKYVLNRNLNFLTDSFKFEFQQSELFCSSDTVYMYQN